MLLNTTLNMMLLLQSMKTSSRDNITENYPQVVNNSLVLDIVEGLHEIYKFHNFVFFISERLNYETETATIFFENFWLNLPVAPNIILINKPAEMDGFLSTPSLCLVLTTARDDPIMDLAARSLKGIRYFKTMFIVFPIVESLEVYDSFEEFSRYYEILRSIYEWVWQKQFINTLMLTILNNVFVLDPYPTLKIINKTSNWSAEKFFPRNDLDFKGYHLQSPVSYDLPRVFYMKRKPIGRRHDRLSGVTGKLFMAFISSINATFSYSYKDNLETEAVNINGIIKMVEEKKLEISVNSYTSMFQSLASTSYPIGINDWCIMVPYRNRSPEHLYLVQSLTQYSWILLGFSVIYIAAGIWFCTPNFERDFQLSFLQALCSLLLIVPLRLMTSPYGRMRYLFVLLFIMGFFITNMFNTKLTSYLSTSITQQQIDSVDDVVAANLPIMLMDFEYLKLKSLNFSQEFLDLVIVASNDQMDKHRDSLNTSFGYSVQTDRWNFLNKQQYFLRKPLFRVSSICIGPYYHVFPIQRDSHLGSPLKQFIMSASQYGFMQYWNSEAFVDAWFLGYIKMMLVGEQRTRLSMTFFSSIWLVWWLGMILAGLTFICEIKGITWRSLKRVMDTFFQWLRNGIVT